MDLRTVFGTNLRQYRKAAGYSQDELAAETGVSREMISRMERGITAPAFTTIELLAEALGVPEASFFGTAMQMPPTGERGLILQRINFITSKMNDRDLSRAAAMLDAMRK